jgi:hypothetical protein
MHSHLLQNNLFDFLTQYIDQTLRALEQKILNEMDVCMAL